MRRPPVSATLIAAPRQLSIPFETKQIEQISLTDRKPVLVHLTQLLLEAANVLTEEQDDDER